MGNFYPGGWWYGSIDIAGYFWCLGCSARCQGARGRGSGHGGTRVLLVVIHCCVWKKKLSWTAVVIEDISWWGGVSPTTALQPRNRPDHECAFLARKLGKTLGGGPWRKARKRRRNVSGNTDPPGGHRPGDDGNPHESPCQKKLRLHRGGDEVSPRGSQNPRSDEHHRTGRMTTSDAIGLRLAKDVIRAPGEWSILHLFLVSWWKRDVTDCAIQGDKRSQPP